MEQLDKYTQWVLKIVEKEISNEVLEVGSGIGNITKKLVKKDLVFATDINNKYLTYLKNIFKDYSNIKIEHLNIADTNLKKDYLNKFDTIICFNVLEHINNDMLALQNMYKYLKTEGKLLLLLPAHKVLYGSLDKSLKHYRRYEKDKVIQELETIGFKIKKIKFINILGVLGWFINSRIFKAKKFNPVQVKLFNYLSFILNLEKNINPPFGLSLLLVTKK